MHESKILTIISIIIFLSIISAHPLYAGTFGTTIQSSGSITIPTQQTWNNQIEEEIFELINEERTTHGLPALSHDPKLDQIAKEWSDELIIIGTLTHGDFSQRIAEIGYSMYPCGEIIAWRYSWTPPQASDFVNAWIASSGHYQIMMTSKNGYMGAGVSNSSNNYYAVVDFRFIN